MEGKPESVLFSPRQVLQSSMDVKMHILCTEVNLTHTHLEKEGVQGSCKAGPSRAEAAPRLSWGKPCDKLMLRRKTLIL